MKTKFSKYVPVMALATGLFLANTPAAHAGFFDALKSAAQAVNQKAQQIEANAPQQKETDADHPLHLEDHYKGSCYGRESATCMDYGELMDQCMAPVNGYYMKMLAKRIEYKLKNEQLTAHQRRNLEEDLAGARAAAKKGSDNLDLPGHKNSQRYLSDISDEDQVWVNAENIRFHNRIMNKCEGADHMGVGHRTEFMTDFGPTGDQAVAQYRKAHPKRRRQTNTCMKEVAGLRYKIMADLMEQKMHSLRLSGKERAEWEEDIAAVRKTAASGGMTMPTVSGPNPYRPLTRLSSPQEQMELNNIYAEQSKVALADCEARNK